MYPFRGQNGGIATMIHRAAEPLPVDLRQVSHADRRAKL